MDVMNGIIGHRTSVMNHRIKVRKLVHHFIHADIGRSVENKSNGPFILGVIAQGNDSFFELRILHKGFCYEDATLSEFKSRHRSKTLGDGFTVYFFNQSAEYFACTS